MFIHCVLLSCFVTCVITDQAFGHKFREELDDVAPWPSIRHASEVSLEKRQAEVAPLNPGQSETSPLHLNQGDTKGTVPGKGAVEQASEGNVELRPMPPLPPQPPLAPLPSQPSTKQPEIPQSHLNTSKVVLPSSTVSGIAVQNENVNATSPPVAASNETKVSDSKAPKAPSFQPDLNNPGVMKRGLIVFGAFTLMAVAYFIFYKRKSKNNDSNNTHGTSDTNQFRYGVLQSDDRRDNLELSRVPLTMESDEDEDEDLEIFDLEQKKKSLSYVNLQSNDDYIVHESREDNRDRDNLLLDIEDANSDTLINWSSNGNKSIL